jgi:hypothetical protein
MKTTNNCYYTLSDGTLTLGNGLFSRSFSGVTEAVAETVTPKSRSLPYYEVTAKKEDGAFLFRLAEGNCTFTGTKWPNEGLRDVGFLSRYGVVDTNWSYHLTMTFYDEENHVTAIHEIGGGNHEN